MTRKNIVFLTGAGISVESGLSTYRGKDGLWTREEFEYFASTICLNKEPDKCLDFYNMRRRRLSEVEPNEAHYLIAQLEKDHDVTIITQNVDDLHERAGSTHVVHLHGEMTKVCSSLHRYDTKYVREYPLTTPIKVGDDAGDGSQLRPYIVMFGENVEAMPIARELVRKADIFVVVGTSLSVYPAATLVDCTTIGIPRYVIDPEDITRRAIKGFTHYKTTATEGLKQLLTVINK